METLHFISNGEDPYPFILILHKKKKKKKSYFVLLLLFFRYDMM
jgi:hypothetical protein